MGVLRLTKKRQEIFKLLIEGYAQSQIVTMTQFSKSTVSQAASSLVKQGYVIPLSKGTPRLYGPGPHNNIIKAIVDQSEDCATATNEVPLHGTTVRQVSKTGFKVNTVLVHHAKVRVAVDKVGDRETLHVRHDHGIVDVKFLEARPYMNHNNVRRSRAKLTVDGDAFTLELEETPRMTRLYIHLPSRELTPPELPAWKNIFAEPALRVINFLGKWGGWKFGEVEFCKGWKTHFAAEDPRLPGSSFSEVIARNPNGKVWLSDSGGRSEIETSEPELAQFICHMPESLRDLWQRLTALTECSRMMAEVDENLIKIETSRLEKRMEGTELGR